MDMLNMRTISFINDEPRSARQIHCGGEVRAHIFSKKRIRRSTGISFLPRNEEAPLFFWNGTRPHGIGSYSKVHTTRHKRCTAFGRLACEVE